MITAKTTDPAGTRGRKGECEYYPCHFEGQDCTWCYCPFYPCLDNETGGKLKISSRTRREVWSCIDCRWIHEDEVARAVAGALAGDSTEREKSLAIRRRILEVRG